MRDDRQRLQDVLEAIERIEKYKTTKENFKKDELIQTWFVRHLQIIGEACRTISEEYKNQHPEIPWKKVMGMRNILVHGYFAIDADIVWSVVEKELTGLRESLKKLS